MGIRQAAPMCRRVHIEHDGCELRIRIVDWVDAFNSWRLTHL